MSRYLIIATLLWQQLSARHYSYTLQKALSLHVVKASAKSLGGYQGFCMQVNIENLSNDSLVILVEAGRRLLAGNKDEQDILVVKESPIALRRHEKKSQTIKGYCCQASKHAPTAATTYAINQLADSALVKVAQNLSKNCFGSELEQDAVWAISDKKPIASIPNTNDSANLVLRQLLADIKGEKLPWYTITKNTFVTQGGQIMQVNQYLCGKLTYNNMQKAYGTLLVYNDKGLEVCIIKSEWLDIGNNLPFQINLPVKGLEKGKYSLVLQTREREVLKEAFEI